MAAGDWIGGWVGTTVIVINGGGGFTPTPPTPVPSPIPTTSPEYVDHVNDGLSRLVLQFRRPTNG